MTSLDWFSPAQLLGYLAFVFGVSCFAQKDDRRFRLLMAAECAAYILHFAWLGNPTAVASSTVSLLRSVLSLYTRSRWVAAGVVALNLGLGGVLARQPADWLPLMASCAGTVALFTLQGIPMRLLMLVGTTLWIANNLWVGSIGGTALEVVIALVNSHTIWRMACEQRKQAADR